MKKIIFAILMIFPVVCFTQDIDELELNKMYFDSLTTELQRDTIDMNEGYPKTSVNGKGYALTYIDQEYTDETLNKSSINLDKVSRKTLRKLILDTLQLPTMRIPMDSINSNPSLKNNIRNQVINNNWSAYRHGIYLYLFNFNQDAELVFSANNINLLNDLGGKAWNFDLYAWTNWANRDAIINYNGTDRTVRQICNMMSDIYKLKINNRIVIKLERESTGILQWNQIWTLIDSYFSLISEDEFDTQLVIYDICKVNNVDEDIISCIPIDEL